MSADRETDSGTNISTWLQHHDLLGALLPFAYRNKDPISQLHRIAAGIDDLPPTAATFDTAAMLGDADTHVRDFDASTHLRTMFRLLGSFQCASTSTGRRWSNPDYCHGSVHQEPWGTPAERVTFAEECAELGAVERADVARHFGVETQTLTWSFEQEGFSWVPARRRGKERFAKTVETVVAWGDRGYTDILDPLPVSYSQVRHWRVTYVADEWVPPEDPTTENGFRRWTVE